VGEQDLERGARAPKKALWPSSQWKTGLGAPLRCPLLGTERRNKLRNARDTPEAGSTIVGPVSLHNATKGLSAGSFG
jgi:hypothetical protein